VLFRSNFEERDIFNKNIKEIIQSNSIKEKKKLESTHLFDIYNKEYFTNPFTDISGEKISPKKNITPKNTKELMDKIISFALQKYYYEKDIFNEYSYLRKIAQEKRFEKIRNRDPTFNTFDLKDEPIENESVNFLKKIKYYGRFLADEGKLCSNYESSKIFDRFKVKRTDCIEFLLESISQANKKNYMLSHLSDASTLSKKLKYLGFETIYVAENTLKDGKDYQYDDGVKQNNLVKDKIKMIKRGNYFTPLDYLVTDHSFHSPAFREFLKNQCGIVFFQEGKHVGFLYGGQLLDAHACANPFFEEVFTLNDFYSKMNNDFPHADYQSAVLFVPGGTVQEFINKNSNKFEKIPNFYQASQKIDSLMNEK